MPTEIQLPVGRIVWGHPLRPQKKTDQQTRKPVLRPDGSTIDQWVIGLAIPEQEFAQKVWPAMEAEARSGFPQGIPPQFSFKYKAGNGTDRTGKPYASREGYAGHYVLTIATEAFAPSVFKYEGNSYRQLTADEIKCGDYILATVSFQVNVPTNKTHTPGLFVNPRGFLLVGYGKEIVGAAADPTQIFGNAPPQFQLPPGASQTPITSAPSNTAPPYGGPGYPPQGPQPGGYAPQPGGPPITTGPQPGYPAPGMPGQPQPGPGYPPQGPQPGPGYPPQGPQPGGYAPQGPQPGGYAPQPGPGYPPQGPQPGGYAPAHDFVQNAGQQQPGGYPQPQYPNQQPGQPGPGMPYPPR